MSPTEIHVADTPKPVAGDESLKRLHDPVLDELWAVKAQINAEGGYDLQTILDRAKQFADPYFDSSGRVRARLTA